MKISKILIAGIAIVAIVTGAWLSSRILRQPPALATATLLPAAIELADFSLTDQDGNDFTRDDLRGRWSLLFFGFTNCPDICPLTLQVLADAQRQLQEDGLAAAPRIVLVSVDPERDSPAILRQYVAHFGAATIALTGDMAELRKLTDGLGIFFEKSAVDGEHYSVDHSTAVIVLDPEGHFRALFGAPHIAATIANDLRLIIAAR